MAYHRRGVARRPVGRGSGRGRSGLDSASVHPVDSPFGGFSTCFGLPSTAVPGCSETHRRALAQLAEHRSPKPKVGGSSPSCPARTLVNGRTRRGEERVGEQRGTPSSSKPEKRTSPATFYRQVVAELRKVVWPTQEQLVTYFIVVHGLRAVHDGARLAARPRASASSSSRSSPAATPSRPPPRPGRGTRPATPDLTDNDAIEVTEQHVSEQYDPVEAGETADRRGDPRGRPRGDRAELAEPAERRRRRRRRDARRGPAAEADETAEATSADADEAADAEAVDRGAAEAEADEADEPRTRSRSSAARCGPSPATGSSCTPTPAWRTG